MVYPGLWQSSCVLYCISVGEKSSTTEWFSGPPIYSTLCLTSWATSNGHFVSNKHWQSRSSCGCYNAACNCTFRDTPKAVRNFTRNTNLSLLKIWHEISLYIYSPAMKLFLILKGFLKKPFTYLQYPSLISKMDTQKKLTVIKDY